MADGTARQGQDEAGLSAADEQLLRELTERARAGGLKLTGEGGCSLTSPDGITQLTAGSVPAFACA